MNLIIGQLQDDHKQLVWHHSTEDIIFDVLLQKNILDKQLLTHALEEHSILEMLTENLHHYCLKDRQHVLDEPRLQKCSAFFQSIANSSAVTVC